jgi:hypothetical protein
MPSRVIVADFIGFIYLRFHALTTSVNECGKACRTDWAKLAHPASNFDDGAP